MAFLKVVCFLDFTLPFIPFPSSLFSILSFKLSIALEALDVIVCSTLSPFIIPWEMSLNDDNASLPNVLPLSLRIGNACF